MLESLQRGEDVDVEKMLGTGDEEKEREWEEGKKTTNPLEISSEADFCSHKGIGVF